MPENPAGGAFAPNAANLPQPGVAYPAGAFDPTQWKAAAPIQTWGHDVNVTPGKTYRYKMRYRIKNPLYNVGGNVAKNAKDTQVFACISEFSPWTKPVTVPEKTNFFVARGLVSGGSRVQFEVFKWEDGTQHAEMFDVSPGDVLGAAKNNIDFSTGWTLVGVQNDNVLLVDKDGKLMIRNQKADESDSLYKQLKNLVAIAAKQNPAGGAVGVGPGGVPAVPPTGGGAVPIPRGP